MQYDNEPKTLITKENAYPILKAFAKEYKKQNGKHNPIEIIIVGGGSILLNYGFRQASQDFDILTQSMDKIKEVSYRIADLYNLPNDWMNTEFVHTASYSDKLREISQYFCSFNNGSVEFRTVKAQYLIAMKMVSAREYRNDISDIVGILAYMKKHEEDISMEVIEEAIKYLYDNTKSIVKEEVYDSVKEYVNLSVEELDNKYFELSQKENETKQQLVAIDQNYPGVVNEDSIENVIANLKKRQETV